MRYEIVLSDEAKQHLRGLTARQRQTAVDAIDRQLAYQPTVVTRNRKRLRSSLIATWELRVGDLRVYYDVEDEPGPCVEVTAVGVKTHNRVRIGNEEVEP